MTDTVDLAKVREPSWRCFHCDAVFHDRESAANHFGNSELEKPVCCIPELAALLRDQQQELAKLHSNEMSDSAKEFHSLGAKHHVEMRRAEEEGYEKGLKDGQAIALSQAAEIKALRERMVEIGEIAVPPDELGTDWHSEAIMLGEKLDRIAALATLTKEPANG